MRRLAATCACIGMVLMGSGVSPAFAKGISDHGLVKSSLSQRVHRIELQITQTLEFFVPKVEASESAISAQIGGKRSVIDAVYNPPAVDSELVTISHDVEDLNRSHLNQLLSQLIALETKLQRAHESVKQKALSQKSLGVAQPDEWLLQADTAKSQFQLDVSSLLTSFELLKSDPESRAHYDNAFRAWNMVKRDGNRINAWAGRLRLHVKK